MKGIPTGVSRTNGSSKRRREDINRHSKYIKDYLIIFIIYTLNDDSKASATITVTVDVQQQSTVEVSGPYIALQCHAQWRDTMQKPDKDQFSSRTLVGPLCIPRRKQNLFFIVLIHTEIH